MVLYFNFYYEYMLYKLSPDSYVSGQLGDTPFLLVLHEVYDRDEEKRLANGFHARAPQLGFRYFVDTVFEYYLEGLTSIDTKSVLEDPGNNKDDWKLYLETVKAWAMTSLKLVIKKYDLESSDNAEESGDEDNKEKGQKFIITTAEEVKALEAGNWSESELNSLTSLLFLDSNSSESNNNKSSSSSNSKKDSDSDNDANNMDTVPLNKIDIIMTKNLTNSQKRKHARMLRETGLTNTELLFAKNMADTQDNLVKHAESMLQSFFETPDNADILNVLEYIGEWPIKSLSKSEDNNGNKYRNLFDQKAVAKLSVDQLKTVAQKLATFVSQKMQNVSSISNENLYTLLPKNYQQISNIFGSREFKDIVAKCIETDSGAKSESSIGSGDDSSSLVTQHQKASPEEKSQLIYTLIGEDQDGNPVHSSNSHNNNTSPSSSSDKPKSNPPIMMTGMKNRMKNRNVNGLLANSKFAIKKYQKSKDAFQNSSSNSASFTSNPKPNSSPSSAIAKTSQPKSLQTTKPATGNNNNRPNTKSLIEVSNNSAPTFSPQLLMMFFESVKEYNQIIPSRDINASATGNDNGAGIDSGKTVST